MSMSFDWGLGIAISAALLFILGAFGFLGVWTYRDAKSRGLQAGMWTAIVVLTPNLLGILIYFLIGRKQQKTPCPDCGSATDPGKAYCPSCGTYIREAQSLQNHPPVRNGLLIAGLVSIALGFLLIVGVAITSLTVNPNIHSSRNYSIGRIESSWNGVWKLSFRYMNGKESRTIKLNQDGSRSMTIDARIDSGAVELGIRAEGQDEKRISLAGLDSPYSWDLSDLPVNTKLSMQLYAEKAKGKIDLRWD